MERIGIIADPHSNLEALEAVIREMQDIDKILCAGDLVGYGPQPNEVIELINSTDAKCVLGNHDYAVVREEYEPLDDLAAKAAELNRKELKKRNLKFLKKLPKKMKLKENETSIFMAHGTPRNYLQEYIYPSISNRSLVKMTQNEDASLIILGHTHIPLERLIQGKLVINPGSVGQPRDRNPKASYMIMEIEDKINIYLERTNYEIEKVEQKIKESEIPDKFGTRLNFGW